MRPTKSRAHYCLSGVPIALYRVSCGVGRLIACPSRPVPLRSAHRDGPRRNAPWYNNTPGKERLPNGQYRRNTLPLLHMTCEQWCDFPGRSVPTVPACSASLSPPRRPPRERPLVQQHPPERSVHQMGSTGVTLSRYSARRVNSGTAFPPRDARGRMPGRIQAPEMRSISMARTTPLTRRSASFRLCCTCPSSAERVGSPHLDGLFASLVG